MLDGLLKQEQELQAERLELLERLDNEGYSPNIELRLEEIDEELESVQSALEEIDEFQSYEREYDAI